MKNGLAPAIMESVLNKRFNTYNLRNFQEFATGRRRTVWYGLETHGYCYPQLWTLLFKSLKEMNSLSQFKRNIKHWICRDCPAGSVKFIFKILDFHNVKSYAFVKLANLANITKKTFQFNFFRYTSTFVYIYLHNWCMVKVAISVQSNIAFSISIVKSDVKSLLMVQSDCWLRVWGGAFWENSLLLLAVDCFQKNLHLQLWLGFGCASGYFVNNFKFFVYLSNFPLVDVN